MANALTTACYFLIGVIAMEILLIAMIWGEWGIRWPRVVTFLLSLSRAAR